MGTSKVGLHVFCILIWPQAYGCQEVEYDFMSENVTHRLMDMNIWSLIVGAFWGVLGGVTFPEKYMIRISFEVLRPLPAPGLLSILPVCGSKCELPACCSVSCTFLLPCFPDMKGSSKYMFTSQQYVKCLSLYLHNL